jgi:succinate dehydrogenase hydrophobic anchor subunit
MRESTLRGWVFATGLATLALLVVHLVLVFSGPGSYSDHPSYGSVRSLLSNLGYVAVLGALLVAALAHAFLGLRRALLDANAGRIWFRVLVGVAVGSTSVLLYLYLATVW